MRSRMLLIFIILCCENGCTKDADFYGVKSEMVRIPSGTYAVGAELDELLRNCRDNYDSLPWSEHPVMVNQKETYCDPLTFAGDSPARTITVKSYYIDKHEVSESVYRICVDADAYEYNGVAANLDSEVPITNINWNEAEDFCEWRGARLPTEDEWEIAARGTTRKFFTWGETFSCQMSRGFFCPRKTSPVNELPDTVGDNPNDKSEFGVMDMSGNVQEFTYNKYSSRDAADRNDLSGCGTMRSYTSLRGGCFECLPHLTLVHRQLFRGEIRKAYVGFRCARPNEDSQEKAR